MKSVLINKCILAPNAAPRNFNDISKTSTTIKFQWDTLSLAQSNNKITWYVITCLNQRDNGIITVSVHDICT